MYLKALLLPLLALVIGALVLALVKRLVPRKGHAPRTKAFHKAHMLTEREQVMFWRIREAFPEQDYLLFAQVGFGALLKAAKGTSALHYTQKRADFVLTDRAFNVVAVIEIDDASHAGRGRQDDARDAMLTSAGYAVVRFNNIPDVDTLRRHIRPVPGEGARPETAPKPATRGSRAARTH